MPIPTPQRAIASVLPKPMLGIIPEIIRFTRLHEWHPGKLPILVGFGLTLSLAAPTPDHNVLWILAAYVLTSLYLATAYMLNNLADAEQDRMADKNIGLEGWAPGIRLVPVVVSAVLGLRIGLALLPPAALAAMIGCYALAWTYSFPPRLKEHVILGPFVAAFAQVPAPALTFALAWGSLPLASLGYLSVAFLYGLRMILVHQLLDSNSDRLTATTTTATVLGIPATRKLVRVMFGLELLSTAVFLFLMVDAGLPTGLLAGLLWPLFLTMIRWKRGKRFQLDGYSYIPLADVHESMIPLLLALSVVMRGGISMIGAFLMVAILFYNRHIERLVRPLTRSENTHD